LRCQSATCVLFEPTESSLSQGRAALRFLKIELNEELFFVESGAANVSRAGEELGDEGFGDVVGEIAVLGSGARDGLGRGDEAAARDRVVQA
jgi:hypothetical protein